MDGYGAAWSGPNTYEPRPGAQRFENWEFNVAAVIAFGVAVEYALQVGIDRIWVRIQHLAGLLRQKLRAIDGVTVCDKGSVQCGIISFSVAPVPAADLQAFLHAQKVNITHSGAHSTMLDMHARGLKEVCRASVHYYNTEQELEHVAGLVAQFLKDAASHPK
jgi:selenocysteine lyase/cysteine desulfurase